MMAYGYVDDSDRYGMSSGSERYEGTVTVDCLQLVTLEELSLLQCCNIEWIIDYRTAFDIFLAYIQEKKALTTCQTT
jgi:hypothetical protein